MSALSEVEDVLGAIPLGPLVGGTVRAGNGTIDVIDPATEGVLTQVADGTVEDALDAVDAAISVRGEWAATSPRRRSEVLRRAFELMTERTDALARLIVLENGKALADARSEVTYAAEFFRWYAEEAVRLTGSIGRAPSGTNNIVVLHQPVGVSLLITPWNFPAAMATRKLAPALAAGCPVVLKPASETPLTALAIVAILHEAGAPAGVVNIVPSTRSDALSSRLLDHPEVRKVSFTGSTEVGRILLAHAARTVVNTGMELGGNAPFVVMADADLDAALDGAMIAKMRNGGSACTAANRFLVHRSLAADFSRQLAERMGRLQVGSGLLPSTDLGPLVNAKTRDKVSSLVEAAVDEGARPLVGGGRPEGRGYFYLPTVLDGVAPDAAILGTEIFGPVAPVVAFDTDDEAVELANRTEFGLVSYLWTRDLRRGMAISERLDAGMVGLNRAVVSDPAAPFGGTKQSGLGREGGHEGMIEFTESKYVALDW